MTFDRYYTTTSECCPSRASILTGQYPHHTGVVANFGPSGYPSFDESSTLATWLHDAGYTTALVGKYLNGYTLDGNHHVPPGWDRWVAIDSVPEERYYRYTLNEDGHLVDFGRRPADYSTSVLTSKAVDFVRTTRESRSSCTSRPSRPTFPRSLRRAIARASTGCRRPTSPAFDEADISDKPWRSRFVRTFTPRGAAYDLDEVRGRQLETLRSLDRSVGRLVGELRRRQLLRSTVIVYLSDNGFLWGEHRLGGKIWPYEESIHLPLVIRTPWRAGDGTVDHHMALNVDIAPTVAALAGVRAGDPAGRPEPPPLPPRAGPAVAGRRPRRVPRARSAAQGWPAALPGRADAPLPVCRLRQRLARAVRHAPRSVAARQRRRHPPLRLDRGVSRAAPRELLRKAPARAP